MRQAFWRKIATSILSDTETIRADAEQEERDEKLRAKQLCYICKGRGVFVCKCGDYWCDEHFGHCYVKGCKNWSYTHDGYGHPYCRAHKDLAEYPDGKMDENPENPPNMETKDL